MECNLPDAHLPPVVRCTVKSDPVYDQSGPVVSLVSFKLLNFRVRGVNDNVHCGFNNSMTLASPKMLYKLYVMYVYVWFYIFVIPYLLLSQQTNVKCQFLYQVP